LFNAVKSSGKTEQSGKTRTAVAAKIIAPNTTYAALINVVEKLENTTRKERKWIKWHGILENANFRFR
jgi:hypothetical protein